MLLRCRACNKVHSSRSSVASEFVCECGVVNDCPKPPEVSRIGLALKGSSLTAGWMMERSILETRYVTKCFWPVFLFVPFGMVFGLFGGVFFGKTYIAWLEKHL